MAETAHFPVSICSLDLLLRSAYMASPKLYSQLAPGLAASIWLARLLEAVSPINARAKGISNLTIKTRSRCSRLEIQLAL